MGGAQSCHDPTLPMSHVSLIMSLQTLLSPALAEGLHARIGFRLGEANYVIILDEGRLEVERASGGRLRCVPLPAPPANVAAVIHGGAPLEMIRVEGDMKLAKRFITLFPLPPKVA